MIYFYYGTDREKIQKTAKATFEALKKKKPDASFVEFDGESITLDAIQEIIATQGLFEKKIVARLKDVLESDLEDDILKLLPEFKKTDNVLIWSEGEMNKAPLEKIKKNAEKVEEFGVKQKAEKKFPTIFKMTDAIASKDKKTAWVLLVEEMQNGTASEEIHGTIFWQIKSILVAKKTRSAEESGLNPYVYTKAKGFSRNWEDEELNKAVSHLVSVYHLAHRGKVNLDLELEKWVLSL